MSGLYVHIPFCRSKCGYCGFYSECGYERADEYFDALIKDLGSLDKKRYDTLYIGGGTPSSVPPFLLSKLLNSLPQTDFIESTIEANPESITDEFLAMVRDFGFTRISIGCQSTNDKVLKTLGRIHSAEDVFKAVKKARSVCKDTALNLDMIYDIPKTEKSYAIKTMEDIILLEPEHISAYSYSFDTGFLKDAEPVDDSLFLLVKERLLKAGYHKYEISNFAKKGHESLHNINYWKLKDYDGVGASAWSLRNQEDRRILRGKTSGIDSYINDSKIFESEEVTEGCALLFEKLVFGLRMLDGIEFSEFNNRCTAECIEIAMKPLNILRDEGFIKWESEKICLTENGELLLDSVQEFLWGYLP